MATKATRQLQVHSDADSKRGNAAGQKRPAEQSMNKGTRKRPVLGDITNPSSGERQQKASLPVKKPSLRVRKAPEKPSTNKAQCSDNSKEVLTSVKTEESEGPPQQERASLVFAAVVSLPPALPEGVIDFDEESRNDPFAESTYAADIFNYYKEREVAFQVPKYMESQPELSPSMRATLVDWMVEVQENFELNHETLYLGVKLVDRYLSLAPVTRAALQLVGATALFLASKYDERCPPSIQDFLYICDDAYSRQELIAMEVTLLKTLNFDLGAPVSYRFLRRYARCAHLDLETLTLARFVLESSLLDYTLISQRDSLMAAAALLQALRMKGMSWSSTLVHYSGYSESELHELQRHLNQLLHSQQTSSLEAIRSKYSHKVFFEVALTPLLPL